MAHKTLWNEHWERGHYDEIQWRLHITNEAHTRAYPDASALLPFAQLFIIHFALMWTEWTH